MLWLLPLCVSSHSGPTQSQNSRVWHTYDAGVLLRRQGEERVMEASVQPTESQQMLLAATLPRSGYAFWVLAAGREPQPRPRCEEDAQSIMAL